MAEFIRVGMSEIAISRTPDVLVAIGLGSCVGVCFYDPLLKCGGMAHVMLPDSVQILGAGAEITKPGKFVDTALPELLKKLTELGALPSRLEVKIAGGAQMFCFNGDTDRMLIGPRNVEATEQLLTSLDLKLAGKNTGGNHGRSVRFDLATGMVTVKMVNSPDIII
ncbi:MAG TPA: chemotaxis protein CheD [Firmicutes bacterium]|jgi:chemotaxis protein CheD|nr:chemotaxis protein CheD [Bacillota bacterium]